MWLYKQIIRTAKGFTLIEVLLSLSIFLLIVAFLPTMIAIVFPNYDNNDQINNQEWELFLQQARIELREAIAINVNSNTLYLTTSHQKTISYEQYKTILRRRVDGTGHEVLIQNISSVIFRPVTEGIIIQVIDLSGELYEERISSMVTLEVPYREKE
ncbi:competence type IV pilus minor pilin ComGF [Cytobacillus sp. IB215665]|uniref:competence type IV pilus minor pilin ComGF n=1 Tax=Cytobacillus sp. IB215665 TaxID=3097357 RepID=UPI002A0C5150|nr:competence type IV pilus minor pilin ComGF [Cytobacillus sp. IB215665]MDX8364255.1 competence type IV pilus minor pilin ComGF [Cytobacillus sp. IB215665]